MQSHLSRRDLAFSLSAAMGLAACGTGSTSAQSSPGDWLFVGTYSRGSSKGIYHIPFHPQRADWGAPELAAETPSPSFLAIHPSRRFLYAVNEVGEFQGEKSGSVSAFALDRASGSLSPLNVVSSKGGGPCHLALSPSGKVLVVANYGGGSTSSYLVKEDGSLTSPVSSIQHVGKGAHPRRQNAPHAHGIDMRVAGDSLVAWVADLGIDRLLAYRVDEATGALTPWDQQPEVPLAPGAGPRHLAIHPSLPVAFVINELNSTITSFALDDPGSQWKELQTLSTLPQDFSGENTTAEIAIHPAGNFVYGSNRGHDSIATFAFNQQSRQLRLSGHTATEGRMPRNFTVHPGGRFLVACNQSTNNLALFAVDSATGIPRFTGKSLPMDFPVCAVFLAS